MSSSALSKINSSFQCKMPMLKHELSLQSPFKKHWSTFSRYRQTLHSGAPTKYQRDAFHEALLHEEHGLRIHIIRISEGSSMSRSVLTKTIILESLLLDILVLVVLKVETVLLFLIRKPCKVSFLLWTQNGIKFVLELYCDPYTLEKK